MSDRNEFGGPLEPCGSPMTGFYRDGCYSTGPEDGLSTRILSLRKSSTWSGRIDFARYRCARGRNIFGTGGSTSKSR